MIEILFRGKLLRNGKWVEGHYLKSEKYHFIVPTNDVQKACDYQETLDFLDYEVEGESVGQYTGVDAKDGNKLFVGDIFSIDKYPFISEGKQNYLAEMVIEEDFSIEFVFHCVSSKLKGIPHGNHGFLYELEDEEINIIGNIHDNPKLLERK